MWLGICAVESDVLPVVPEPEMLAFVLFVVPEPEMVAFVFPVVPETLTVRLPNAVVKLFDPPELTEPVTQRIALLL